MKLIFQKVEKIFLLKKKAKKIYTKEQYLK